MIMLHQVSKLQFTGSQFFAKVMKYYVSCHNQIDKNSWALQSATINGDFPMQSLTISDVGVKCQPQGGREFFYPPCMDYFFDLL